MEKPWERDPLSVRFCVCCNLMSATMVAATFVMTVSFVQFLLILFYLISYCVANSVWLGVILNSVLGGYVGLAACDLVMITLSIVMIDRNAREKTKSVLIVWLVSMGIYLLFEASLNMTFFVTMFSSIDAGYTTLNAFGIDTVLYAGLIVYWLLKLGMYITAMVAVNWRWHQLERLERKKKSAGSPMPRTFHQSAVGISSSLVSRPVVQQSMTSAPVSRPVVYQSLASTRLSQPVVHQRMTSSPSQPIVYQSMTSAPVSRPVVPQSMTASPTSQPVVYQTVPKTPTYQQVGQPAQSYLISQNPVLTYKY